MAIGLIYLIENLVNSKVYVGKTYRSVEQRWKEHIKDSLRYPDRLLYKAFSKYGIENFIITEIAKYAQDILEEKEKEFIHFFNSFSEGYNNTLGGEGRRTITVTDLDIIAHYVTSNNLTNTAAHFNISRSSVKDCLIRNNIQLNKVISRPQMRKRIICISNGIEFESLTSCAQYLIDNGICNSKLKSVMSSLGKACNGNRNTYKGLIFKYI